MGYMGDDKWAGTVRDTKPYGVREHVQRFCDELIEGELAEIVDLCDKVEAGMIEDQAALFLDDEHDQVSGGSDGGESEGDDGTMPEV